MPSTRRIALITAALGLLGPTGDQPRAADARADPCHIQLRTRLTRWKGGYRLAALATNKTGATLEVRLPDRCPAGPVRFTGLPEGHDYHRTCTKGACAETRPFVVIALPPRKTVVLDVVDIDPAGSNCNQPLPPGRYGLGFELPSSDARLCGPAPVWLEQRARPQAQAQPRCPRKPACGLACPGPFARDERGCALCACEKEGLGP